MTLVHGWSNQLLMQKPTVTIVMRGMQEKHKFLRARGDCMNVIHIIILLQLSKTYL